MYLTAQQRKSSHRPCAGPSPTKSHSSRRPVVPIPELRWYYFRVESFWPFGFQCSYPRPDCVSKVEETSKFLHYFFRPGHCSMFHLTRVALSSTCSAASRSLFSSLRIFVFRSRRGLVGNVLAYQTYVKPGFVSSKQTMKTKNISWAIFSQQISGKNSKKKLTCHKNVSQEICRSLSTLNYRFHHSRIKLEHTT